MTIDVVDADALEARLRARTARNTIGKALGKAYPDHPWYVAVTDDGTVAQVTCPAISDEFGMVIHINQIADELERKAVRMGGELLERFNVSRQVADFGHVLKDARGNAVGGKRGEQ